MKKSNTVISNTIKESVETEGARRATGVSTDSATLNRATIGSLPDTEVTEKGLRRKFTASYKLVSFRKQIPVLPLVKWEHS